MRKSMLAAALLSATTAHAAMPKRSYITQNGLELTPKLSVGAMYDDNIFSMSTMNKAV